MLQNIFDEEEFNYLINTSYIQSYPELLKSLNTPHYKMSEIGPKHRDATYWDQKNILPVVKGKTKTLRKYTLKQAIWIKLIQQLRSLDVSLAQIRAIKSEILGDELNVYDLMQDENIQKVIEQIASHAGHLNEYKKLLKDPEFKESIKQENIDIFELIILYTMVFKRNVCYIITVKDKKIECFPFSFEKIFSMGDKNNEVQKLLNSPHIVVSVSDALRELVIGWIHKDWIKKHSLLSIQEQKIIELLKDEKTKELTIVKNGDEVDRVIQVNKNNKLAVDEFANYVMRNGYQTITVKTRNGEVVNFRNEISLKIN